MGVRIEDFSDKWKFYKDRGRAQVISAHFRKVDAINDSDVAATFPSAQISTWPYAGAAGGAISLAGFNAWLMKESLPNIRVSGFQRLTGVQIEDWQRPRSDFERYIQRRAGEVVGWADLARHAVRGVIELEVKPAEAELRLQPIAAVSDEAPPTQVWPGCRARVWLPEGVLPGPEEHRRAWFIADYGDPIFVLDPLRGATGASNTRLRATTEALPRNREHAVGLSNRFLSGQTFEAVVLTFDLDDQSEEVVAQFAGLEDRLVAANDVYHPSTYRAVREALDEAALLIRAHNLDHQVYREPCVIVAAPPRRTEEAAR